MVSSIFFPRGGKKEHLKTSLRLHPFLCMLLNNTETFALIQGGGKDKGKQNKESKSSACACEADGITGMGPSYFRGDTFSNNWEHILFNHGHQRFCLRDSLIFMSKTQLWSQKGGLQFHFFFYYSFMCILLLCTHTNWSDRTR